MENIIELIPKFYLENKMNRTGVSGIFAASLELVKEELFQYHKKIFDKLLVKNL